MKIPMLMYLHLYKHKLHCNTPFQLTLIINDKFKLHLHWFQCYVNITYVNFVGKDYDD